MQRQPTMNEPLPVWLSPVPVEPPPRRGRGFPGYHLDPDAIWPILLEMIANGASLTGALRRIDPSPSYFYAKKCLRNDPNLRQRYDQACEDRADRLAEELLELADTPIPEHLDGPGKSAYVNHLRIKIDARKWAACKLYPRRYGERLDMAVTSTQIDIRAVLLEAQSRVIEGSATRAREDKGENHSG